MLSAACPARTCAGTRPQLVQVAVGRYQAVLGRSAFETVGKDLVIKDGLVAGWSDPVRVVLRGTSQLIDLDAIFLNHEWGSRLTGKMPLHSHYEQLFERYLQNFRNGRKKNCGCDLRFSPR